MISKIIIVEKKELNYFFYFELFHQITISNTKTEITTIINKSGFTVVHV